MTISNFLDKGLKKISSIFFRILIIVYALSIFIRYYYYFNPWYILVCTVAYFSLFLFFRKDKYGFRVLRLLNDYVYITYILYPIGIDNIHLSTFVLLPLINLVNHTGDRIRKSFSLQLFAFSIASILILCSDKRNFYFLVAISAIALISFVTAMRFFLAKINDRMMEMIEDLYYSQPVNNKNHLILKKLITAINNEPFISTAFNIKNVSIYNITKGESYNVSLSSEFIYNYSFDFKHKDFHEPLNLNLRGEINNIKLENAVALRLTVQREEEPSKYFVVIQFNKNTLRFVFYLMLDKVFIPLLTRMINILIFEKDIQLIKKGYIEKTKIELESIDSTTNAIHFLANKLTPITNYFAMLKKIESKEITDEQIGEMKKLISEELRRAQLNLMPIQEKMQQIAIYTNSATQSNELIPVDIKSLINILRNLYAQSCFIKFGFIIKISEADSKKKILLNKIALDFVFTELIDNYNKHSEEPIITVIYLEDGELIIQIENPIKNFNTATQEIADYINEFNSLEISELLQRKVNKGIKFLKQYLQKLTVKFDCKLENKNLLITLKFKIYESSHI